VKLIKEQALRVEKQHRKKYGPRNTYIFKCRHSTCTEEIRARADGLKKHKGFCQQHSQQKRPFESIYMGLFHDHRKTKVELTYDEYLEFTKISYCHYCGNDIPWVPYGVVNGKYTSRAYFLDRKDHSIGYTKDNCVVCCTFCNRLRSNDFTYKQFLQIGFLLQKFRGETYADTGVPSETDSDICNLGNINLSAITSLENIKHIPTSGIYQIQSQLGQIRQLVLSELSRRQQQDLHQYFARPINEGI
jgi:hypothetical protein